MKIALAEFAFSTFLYILRFTDTSFHPLYTSGHHAFGVGFKPPLNSSAPVLFLFHTTTEVLLSTFADTEFGESSCYHSSFLPHSGKPHERNGSAFAPPQVVHLSQMLSLLSKMIFRE